MKVTIRRTEDLQAIHELDRLTFSGDKPTLECAREQAHEWWVAEAEGLPIGFVGVHVGPKGASIVRVGVLPEARGKGLQKRLCRVAIRWAKKQSCARVYTYVLSTNIPSMRSLLGIGMKPYRTYIVGPRQFILFELRFL